MFDLQNAAVLTIVLEFINGSINSVMTYLKIDLTRWLTLRTTLTYLMGAAGALLFHVNFFSNMTHGAWGIFGSLLTGLITGRGGKLLNNVIIKHSAKITSSSST